MTFPALHPDSVDGSIWESVYDRNEYRLPDSMKGWLCLDVGGHIGSFACAAKARGAAEVWSVEPDASNLALLMENFHAAPGTGCLQPFHAACWRSDRMGDRLSFEGHDGLWTFGAHTVGFDGRTEVPVLQLDHLIKLATDWGRRRVDVLKLDCEGAEWPILFTSRAMHLVDRIVGEYHLGPIPLLGPAGNVEGVTFGLDALRELLRASGFVGLIEERESGWGPFSATRRLI